MSTTQFLITFACILSSGVWLAVGLYKITHIQMIIGGIRAHSIPFPVFSFWLSVIVELGGAALMITQQQIALTAVLWLIFLIVATPIFHGRVINKGTIDYMQLVHCGKNVSIAGGLVALIALDGTVAKYFASLPAVGTLFAQAAALGH